MRINYLLVSFVIFITACVTNNPNSGPLVKSFSDIGKDHRLLPIVRTAPMYPSSASRQRITGYVILKFSIDTNGGVENIEVIESVPSKVFDGAAKKAVEKWKYAPLLEDGKPIYLTDVKTKLAFNIEE